MGILGCIAIVVLVLFAILETYLVTHLSDKNCRYFKIVFWILVTCSLISVFTVTAFADTSDDLTQRIQELSNALSDASRELSFIQQDIEDQLEYVEQLNDEAKMAKDLIALSNDQVLAIQNQISKVVKKENSIGFIQNTCIAVTIYCLGLYVSYFQQIINKKERAQTRECTGGNDGTAVGEPCRSSDHLDDGVQS